MNLFLTLRTIIPLITLMTGVLLPTNIALAGSYAPSNKASIKQETLGAEEPTVEYHKTGGIRQLLFSKKAQQIELSIFASAIFLTVVIPRLFNQSKKNSQSLKSSKKHDNQREQINNTEQNIVFLEVIRENKKKSSLEAKNSEKFNNQAKIELENQSEQEQKAS